MTTYEEINSRIALLNDDELREVFERCSDLYNDRQRVKRNILKQELTDKLYAVVNEILNNNFSLTIENLNVDFDNRYDNRYKNLFLMPDENFEISLE